MGAAAGVHLTFRERNAALALLAAKVGEPVQRDHPALSIDKSGFEAPGRGQDLEGMDELERPDIRR